MKPYTLRRVPWTCTWGRFGVAIEDPGAPRSWIDNVFWTCHHPTRASQPRLTVRGECEHCPFWGESAHFRDPG